MHPIRTGLMTAAWAIASVFCANHPPLQATPLEELQRRETIRIGVKDNLRPLGFRGQAGELQGLEIEVARQLVADILGREITIEFVPLTNQERLDSLLQGEVDLIIAQLGVNSSRQRLVNFSPYYYLDGVGFVTKRTNLTESSQITDERVVVLPGSQAIAAIQAYFPSATLVVASSYQEALSLLDNNQADVFAGDHSVLTGWVQQYPGYRLLPAWLDGNPLAIAFPKGRQHQTLQTAINETVIQWRESGWLQDRINHWGLP